jgi:hypothetical protein
MTSKNSTSCHSARCRCSQSRLKLPMPIHNASVTSHVLSASRRAICVAHVVSAQRSCSFLKSASRLSGVIPETVRGGRLCPDLSPALFSLVSAPVFAPLSSERPERPWVITVHPSSLATCCLLTRPRLRPPMATIFIRGMRRAVHCACSPWQAIGEV